MIQTASMHDWIKRGTILRAQATPPLYSRTLISIGWLLWRWQTKALLWCSHAFVHKTFTFACNSCSQSLKEVLRFPMKKFKGVLVHLYDLLLLVCHPLFVLSYRFKNWFWCTIAVGWGICINNLLSQIVPLLEVAKHHIVPNQAAILSHLLVFQPLWQLVLWQPVCSNIANTISLCLWITTSSVDININAQFISFAFQKWIAMINVFILRYQYGIKSENTYYHYHMVLTMINH